MGRRPSLVNIVFVAAGLALGIVAERQHVPGALLLPLTRVLPSYATPAATTAPSAPSLTPSVIPQDMQGHLVLFILAGQSNMSGRAPLPSPTPEPDKRIYNFGNDYRWHVAAEPVDTDTSQVDMVSDDPAAAFGPSLQFAASLLVLSPTLRIGLIPCAHGATTIMDWERSVSDVSLYGSCVKRVRAASTMGQLAGVLFFQGESDAQTPALALPSVPDPVHWASRFTNLAQGWRMDSGSPNLPIVYAQIGTTTTPADFPNWSLVQAQQQSVHIPAVSMIQTDDLPLLQDGIHFTAEGYREIGKRFAAAMFALISATR